MLQTGMAYLEQLFGPAWPAVWTLAGIVAIVAPLLLGDRRWP